MFLKCDCTLKPFLIGRTQCQQCVQTHACVNVYSACVCVDISVLHLLGTFCFFRMIFFKETLPSAIFCVLSLRLLIQLSFSEAMRNKARLSITGSVGENGRVLTPDCPKAVHAGHASLRHPGLAVVSSGLP